MRACEEEDNDEGCKEEVNDDEATIGPSDQNRHSVYNRSVR